MQIHPGLPHRSPMFISLIALVATLGFGLIAAPRASAEIEYVTVEGKMVADTGTYDGDPGPDYKPDCTADPFIIWEQVPGEHSGEPLTAYKVHFFDNGQAMKVDLYNRATGSPPFNDGAINGGVNNEQIYPPAEPGTHRWQIRGGSQGQVEDCDERAAALQQNYAGPVSVEVPVEVTEEPDPPVDDPPGDGDGDGDGGSGDDGDGTAACEKATTKLDKAKAKLKKAKKAKKNAEGKKAKKKAAEKLKKAKSKKKKAKKAEQKNC